MSETKRVPKQDGKYTLPDRRIFIKLEDRCVVIGHRDKKIIRQFEKRKSGDLRKLLMLPCYGAHKAEELQEISKSELIYMLYPRPKISFHISWLWSGCEEAKRLKRLIQQAEKL